MGNGPFAQNRVEEGINHALEPLKLMLAMEEKHALDLKQILRGAMFMLVKV